MIEEELMMNQVTTDPSKEQEYISRTKVGACKNDWCENGRREGSAYCQQCSTANALSRLEKIKSHE